MDEEGIMRLKEWNVMMMMIGNIFIRKGNKKGRSGQLDFVLYDS